jgi:putative membrane protein
MGWMAIWWIIGVALIVVVVRALLRASAGRAVTDGRESPEEILKRRYASGEIDRETYQRMLADLKDRGGRHGES